MHWFMLAKLRLKSISELDATESAKCCKGPLNYILFLIFFFLDVYEVKMSGVEASVCDLVSPTKPFSDFCEFLCNSFFKNLLCVSFF